MIILTENERNLLNNCFFAEWCRLDELQKKRKNPDEIAKLKRIKAELQQLEDKMDLNLRTYNKLEI